MLLNIFIVYADALISLQQFHDKTSSSVGGPQFSLDYWVCVLQLVVVQVQMIVLTITMWYGSEQAVEGVYRRHIITLSQHCTDITIIVYLCELHTFSNKYCQDIRILSYIHIAMFNSMR